MPPEMDVDEWNKIYAETVQELHEVLAKQLILDSRQDEQYLDDENDRMS